MVRSYNKKGHEMIIEGRAVLAERFDIGITMILLETDGGYVDVFSLDSTKVRSGDWLTASGKFRIRGDRWEFYTKKIAKWQ